MNIHTIKTKTQKDTVHLCTLLLAAGVSATVIPNSGVFSDEAYTILIPESELVDLDLPEEIRNKIVNTIKA